MNRKTYLPCCDEFIDVNKLPVDYTDIKNQKTFNCPKCGTEVWAEDAGRGLNPLIVVQESGGKGG